MPSGPQSGKFGIIHAGSPLAAVTPMFNWTLMDDMAPELYYASNTRMGAQRNTGISDWNGSFNMFSGFPLANTLPIVPGTKLSVELFTAPDTGIYGNEGTIYYGDIIVDSITITWQWQPTASLVTTVNFSAVSCIANKKGVIDDLSLVAPAKMCDLDISYSEDGQAWVPWDNLIQLTFNLTSANQPVVNSSTLCCTHRKGGNIDWNIVATEQEAEQLWTPGTDLFFKMETQPLDAAFWLLQYGKIRNYSNITVNRQTGEIQSKDVNVDMNGIVGENLGEIIMPNAAKYWPPAPTTLTVGFGGINEPPWDV